MADPLDRLKAALTDRYTIQRELGRGGMATVLLAEDLKHHRQVALKVLRPELTETLGTERFLREIETTAQLNHPNILPLFDSGRADEFLYYVMPYVEEETLRDQLNRERQLGVEEAVRITTEVADALHYAHRHGVVHRDIKPENILLHDGRPLVADFGIALAVSAATTGRMTETGLMIGTPYYMSPEQASADRDITSRSDVFSLGAVLYEMLTGAPPHTGTTAQQVILNIIAEEPQPITLLRKTVPPNVAAAVATALQKLPADRFPDAAQFGAALRDPSFRGSGPEAVIASAARGSSSRSRILRWVPWAIAAAAIAAAVWGRVSAVPTAHVMRVQLILPEIAERADVALSPDGRTIAYPGSDGGLFVRRLDELEAHPLPGTVGVTAVTFSPDGLALAYAAGSVWRIDLDGRSPTRLADSVLGGLDWAVDGYIYFGHSSGQIARVPANGGAVERLTVVDTALAGGHRFPVALPAGRVLFRIFRWPAFRDEIAVLDLSTREVHVLSRGTSAAYVPRGFLVVGRSDGVIAAARFDPSRFDLDGVPRPIESRVFGGFDLSRTGALLYRSASGQAGLLVVDRRGHQRGLPDEIAKGGHPRVSPDGRRIALELPGASGIDIWVFGLADSTLTRLTFDGDNIYPAWSTDGEHVLYASAAVGAPGGRWTFYRRRVDGVGEAERVLDGEASEVEIAEVPGGKGVVYRVGDRARGQSIDIYYLAAGASEPRALAADPRFAETSPAVSPDGRWVAYVSDESGRGEVYVRALNGQASLARSLVSTNGGTEPAWSRDGRSLYFRSQDQLVVAGVATSPSFAVRDRRSLFSTTPYEPNRSHAAFDVLPGDAGFVFTGQQTPGPAVLVLNWAQSLDARVAR